MVAARTLLYLKKKRYIYINNVAKLLWQMALLFLGWYLCDLTMLLRH